MIFASYSILKKTSDVDIMSRGISDHAPLFLKLSLGPPGERLWRLLRYWIEDEGIQEMVQEGICHYWLDNVDTTTPLVTWDAFKTWTRGEYMPRISAARKKSAHSLEGLEDEARLKEEA